MTTLYFTDAGKRAADHLMATPFGERLRDVATFDSEAVPYPSSAVSLDLPEGVTDRLSTGECVMLGALAGFASGIVADRDELAFREHDLHMVDDEHWDALIVARFIARGRAFAVDGGFNDARAAGMTS